MSLPVLLFTQTEEWVYKKSIVFPATDTAYVRPFLCAVDASGNLWVISSKATDTSAHNALWKAGPNDDVFTLVYNYTARFDTTNVHSLRGITTIQNDVLVVFRQPAAINPAGVSGLDYFKNGNPQQRVRYGFGFGQAGYGTFVFGLSATKDSFVYAGTTYQAGNPGPTPRVYNFTSRTITNSSGSADPGVYVPPPFYASCPGGYSAAGADVIRDIAVIPNGDYNNPNTPFYTSRNSSEDNPTAGNVAVWTGGTQIEPKNYRGQALTDFAGFLALGRFVPSGIYVDKKGRLWVCRPDSGFQTVKAFEVAGNFAMEVLTLEGAPFVAPCDVALSPDESRVYVIDMFARRAFVFEKVTSIAEKSNVPETFYLHQNYPNPFNSSTAIIYEIPRDGFVRINIYNSLGQKLTSLVNSIQSAGKHIASFNAEGLPSGVYYYQLEFDNFKSSIKKMVLIK
ncbi:MAG: T9SS type A sorting domain-containing protein [Candidatus Kryptonium sp.]|nr:T9SS type A sorting domain-containing protein [Candidatus Kryptonium sp.]